MASSPTTSLSLPSSPPRVRFLQFLRKSKNLLLQRSEPLRKIFQRPGYNLVQLNQFIASEGAKHPWIRRQIDPRSLRALEEQRFIRPEFRETATYCPPPADLVFVSVCNDKYAPGLEALILSLLEVYPHLTNSYLVYHDGQLSPFSQERLLSLYPHFQFIERDPQRYQVQMSHYVNHQRVGLLGYLSLEALALQGPSRVVILDSDLLILGDISVLWEGERIKAVPDIGFRPFGIVSASTGRPVINSGVLSFPTSALGPEASAEAQTLLQTVNQCSDPDLLRFADQKFWNLYLAGKDVELLPQNWNTIKTLLQRHYASEWGNIKILHLTGPKPWYSFLNTDLLSAEDREAFQRGRVEDQVAYSLWNQKYHAAITQARLRQFREQCQADLEELKGSQEGKPVALIGNGPSLKQTDLNLFKEYEKMVFNWFVHHPDFDTIAPEHLILPSHLFFGGWHTPHPQIPESFLEALLAKKHRPHLWVSFYFKPFIEKVEALRGYRISYFLYEKPFRKNIADCGVPGFDLQKPLVDSHTGVLTVGVPLALHLGAQDLVLVGCDSNYTSPKGSYFYPSSKHTTQATNERQLLRTWAPHGPGPLGYRIVLQALHERGVHLWNATQGGALDFIPRLSNKELLQLAEDFKKRSWREDSSLSYPSAAE